MHMFTFFYWVGTTVPGITLSVESFGSLVVGIKSRALQLSHGFVFNAN